jgi:hypothetical protein
MNIGENLQDEALRKEENRIRYKREVNRIRAERIHNARNRLIGLDVDALDAQVAEVQRNRQNDRLEDRLDRESLVWWLSVYILCLISHYICRITIPRH